MDQVMNQRDQIIDYIKRFGAITPMDAFMDLGITKLATRISELKAKGYQFDQHYIHIKNRYGKNVQYMCYRLKEA